MKNLEEEIKYCNKGITLISLVVTIIVLLILAGVTIATLTGNNGILTRAQEAKNKTEQAEKDEKEKLVNIENMTNEYLTGTEVEQVTDQNPGVLEIDEMNANTFIINSIEDLVFFAYDVTNGNNYEGKTVNLGSSFDFSSTKSYVNPLRIDYGKYGYDGELKTLLTTGEGFKIIQGEFSGNFDSKGFSIYNLHINIYDEENKRSVGLFLINKGTIKNLKLINSNVDVVSKNYAITGNIVGENYGIIENCFSSRKNMWK